MYPLFFEEIKTVLDPELFVSLDVDPYHLKNVYLNDGRYTFIDFSYVESRTSDSIPDDFHDKKYRRLYKEGVDYLQVWSDTWAADPEMVKDHLRKRFLDKLGFIPRGYITTINPVNIPDLLGTHYNPYKASFGYYAERQLIFAVFLSMPDKSHWTIERIYHQTGQNVALHMEGMMEKIKYELDPKSISVVLDPSWDDTSWTGEVDMVLETKIQSTWLVNTKMEKPERMDNHKLGMNILANPLNSNCKTIKGIKKEKFTWKRK